MAWGIIRKATEEDIKKLQAAAERFINRHNIEGESVYDIEFLMQPYSGCTEEFEMQARYLRKLWIPIVRRALNEPNAEGIVGGYVGYSAQ